MSATTAPLILIVDDEDAVRNFVARALSLGGYRTVMAGGPNEALTIVGSIEPPALLLTDLMMPEMQGDELARRMRLTTPDLKVVYLTGFADKLFEERQVLWANESFLEKPVSIAAIQEAVSLALFGHTRGIRS